METKRRKTGRIRWRRNSETWRLVEAITKKERRSIASWLEVQVVSAATARLEGQVVPMEEPRRPKDMPPFNWQLLPKERELILKAAELDEMTISRWVDGVVTAIVWGEQESGR